MCVRVVLLSVVVGDFMFKQTDAVFSAMNGVGGLHNVQNTTARSSSIR